MNTNNEEFEVEQGNPHAELEARPPFPIGITSSQLPGEEFKPGAPYAEVVTFTNYDARPLNATDIMLFCGSLVGV